MAVLHLVMSTAGLQAAVDRKAPEDSVVLMHDACYELHEGAYRLKDHVLTRGIEPSDLDIDYASLVKLTATHRTSITWR